MQDKIQHKLIQEISNLLKIDPNALGIETELSEYGFDSISLTSFSNKLNADYQLELTPTIFFEYPTIKGFAHFLAKLIQQKWAHIFRFKRQKNRSQSTNANYQETFNTQIHSRDTKDNTR